LTAAHLLSDSERDNRNQLVTKTAETVVVIPAQDGSTEPFNSAYAKLPGKIVPAGRARPASSPTAPHMAREELRSITTEVAPTGTSGSGPPEAEWLEADTYATEGRIHRGTAAVPVQTRLSRLRARVGNDFLGEHDAMYEEPLAEDAMPNAEWDVGLEEERQDAGMPSFESERPTISAIADVRPVGVHAEPFDENPSIESPEGLVPPGSNLSRLAFMADLAAPLDPGIYTATGQYLLDPSLKPHVEAVAKRPTARGLQFALVDLTSGVTSPKFYGIRHTQQAAIASIGKIFVMYAAFQLRAQMQRLRAAIGAATNTDVWAAARTRWLAMMTPAAGAPVTTISGSLGRRGDLLTWNGSPIALPGGSSIPALAEIFGDHSSIPFQSRSTSFVSTTICDEVAVLLGLQVEGLGGKREFVKFLQRMRSMIGISDDRATASCMMDIGFAYLASLMVQSGLWHPARGGGIWLATNYTDRSWRQSPLGGALQNGTAGAVATFLTLLQQDRLVDAGSCSAMRRLMLKGEYPGACTTSPVQQALASVGRTSKVHSKHGLLHHPDIFFDAAIVKRTEAGKHLHYAVVILNAPNAEVMRDIAIALDDCIKKVNGVA
jgi:hypothetical protein